MLHSAQKGTTTVCKGCPEGTKLASCVILNGIPWLWTASPSPPRCQHLVDTEGVDITNHVDRSVGAFRGARGLHEPLAATQLAEAQLLGHLRAMLMVHLGASLSHDWLASR